MIFFIKHIIPFVICCSFLLSSCSYECAYELPAEFSENRGVFKKHAEKLLGDYENILQNDTCSMGPDSIISISNNHNLNYCLSGISTKNKVSIKKMFNMKVKSLTIRKNYLSFLFIEKGNLFSIKNAGVIYCEDEAFCRNEVAKRYKNSSRDGGAFKKIEDDWFFYCVLNSP